MKHIILPTLFLSLTVPLASPSLGAAEPSSNADAIQPMLDRLAEMDFAAQQAWLQQLEERATRAARAAFPPDEAQQKIDQVSGLLHQELVTWDALREAISRTEALERAAVEKWTVKRPVPVIETPVVEEPVVETKPLPPKQTPQPVRQPWPELHDRPIAPAVEPRIETPIEEPVELEEPEVVAEPPRERRLPERPTTDLSSETRVEPPHPAERTVETPAVTLREMPPGAVQVKIDELAARIAGCNLAFRALEAELEGEGHWDAKRLEPLMKRLKILAVRRNDLELFKNLLPAKQRSKMARLETTKTAVSQIGSHIFDARKAVSSDQYEGTDEERRAELERLESLSRQLAEVVGAGQKTGN